MNFNKNQVGVMIEIGVALWPPRRNFWLPLSFGERGPGGEVGGSTKNRLAHLTLPRPLPLLGGEGGEKFKASFNEMSISRAGRSTKEPL
jgi:hypothetical protein